MQKVWNIKEQPDEDVVEALAGGVGVSPAMARVLTLRGVSTPAEARGFVCPDLRGLHDPFLMRDMDRAVGRIEAALAGGERILVYGDYDVDGVTAVALVFRALGALLAVEGRLGFYIPDRFSEGYGISRQGVEYARGGGYTLVIALDCGIKAVARMREARQMGIDFIICDHHVAGDELPDVVACLDAKRPDCPYPDKNLSGCGVGFKLMEALYLRLGADRSSLMSHLDLLAVSIASDIVPMTGENRILAHHGLRRLNSNPNVGLLALMERAGLEPGRISVADIIFKIGPRLNAAGRMRSGNTAVRLLLAAGRAEADRLSRDIDFSNEERKDLDREITREAMRALAADPSLADANAITLYNPEWSKGVIGIVASRLSETFLRPAVVLTRSQADPRMAAGSARTVAGFDLYGAIEACADLLEDFGGHTYAAGLTMRLENVEPFRRRLASYADKHAERQERRPHIDVDTEIVLDDISDEFIAQLDLLQPYGPDNARPVFVSRGVYDYGTSKTFGHSNRHLKLDIIDARGRGVHPGIGFGLGEWFADVSRGAPFDICYTIESNEHRGKTTTQLMIKDIHISDKQ